ncbi:MAG: flagellar basal body P-ring biosynthesis protein FlgA [Hyphomonadaceae bacterium BRH_c29]|jgi:flagella basal body P-ring formation protein FlgA|nr:MAG: flagellar basal body P-ring biosynthesis protein FlgA [Hyphomonadaceae bacterium BRH_c29]
MMSVFALGLGLLTAFADSSSLVAAEVIRSGDPVTSYNATTEEGDNAIGDPLLGREVVRTVYAGKPITYENTRAPILVRRNQVVTVKYIKGGLEISATGRALGEAGLNESVTVLNQQSKQTVQGIVQENGWVLAQ